MLVKNVKTNWAFISKVDTNNNYRITFIVNEKQDEEIKKYLNSVLAEKTKTDPSKVDWYGSRKVDEETGEISYTAKCAKDFKNKKGETITRELPVYNRKAQLIPAGEVPNIANGAIVNLDIDAYFASHLKKQGVMLSLRSLQLLEYKEYTGANPYADEDTPFGATESNSDTVFKHNGNDNDDLFA